MKHLFGSINLKGLFTLIMLTVVQAMVLAQDAGSSGSGSGSNSVSVTRTTETTSSNWYTSPWVWVIGAAVFILLLVALMRGGGDRTGASRTDKVTVTKSTSSDADVV
jgi:hypothetical protein